MTLRRTGIVAALATVALLVTACGGNDAQGGGPTPFEDDSSGTPTTPAAEPSSPTSEPTAAPTTQRPAKKALVIVNPGKYGKHPAVAGFTLAMQEFYRARLTHNPKALNAWSSTIFFTDNQTDIVLAKSQGLVMRPPGKIVVRGVRKGPIGGSFTVDACFGPTMSWYDTRKKKLTNDLPNGSAIAMDMHNAGSRWELHQAHLAKFSCTTVKYPAG